MVPEVGCCPVQGSLTTSRLRSAVQAWLAPDAGEAAVVALFDGLERYASGLLRRRRLVDVEASDIAADVLFHGGAPLALRCFVERQVALHGIDLAVRGLYRAVQNAAWRLHEERDPTGARAYRAVRLLTARSLPAGMLVGTSGFVLGPASAPRLLQGLASSAEVLAAAASRAEFAGIWQLRCHRALARRLAALFAAVQSQAERFGLRLEFSRRELQQFVASALRAQVHNELLALAVDGDEGQQVVARGRERQQTAAASDAWDYAALDGGHVGILASLLQQDLAAGELSGRRLYGARRQRLAGIVAGWLQAGSIVDPLPQLELLGLRPSAAFDDRALLREALQAAGRSLRPEDLSA